jgi:hypothetical protein
LPSSGVSARPGCRALIRQVVRSVPGRVEQCPGALLPPLLPVTPGGWLIRSIPPPWPGLPRRPTPSRSGRVSRVSRICAVAVMSSAR